MSWRDDLIPGNYNGAAFVTSSHEWAGGRRLAVHEFPFEGGNEIEDLGEKAGEFMLETFVLGDDYFAARDALINELQSGGPGLLAHPFLGSLLVSVREWKMKESFTEGRMARFSLTFVQETDVPVLERTLTDDQVSAAVAEVQSAAQTTLAASTVPTAPQARALAIASISNIAGTLAGIANTLQGWANTALVDPLASVLQQEQSILYQVTRLAALPSVTADTLATMARAVFTLFADDPETGAAVALAWAQTADTTGDYGVWQAATGLSACAGFMATITYSNQDDAVAARDAWLDTVDDVEPNLSDDLFTAMSDLRAGVVADITARAAMLPLITTYTPTCTLPALVLAWMIYGDATRDGDLIDRNQIERPGCVPGGVPLEVLTDA